MKKYTLLLITPILLCACGETLQCPSFDEAERERWLPQAKGSTVTFEQETDHSLISFTVTDNKASEAYQEKPRNSGLGYFNKECKADARIRLAPSDSQSAWVTAFNLSIISEFIEDKEQSRSLKYQVGDFEGGFSLLPTLSMSGIEANARMDRDSIVDNLALGGKVYERVLIQTRSIADTAGKVIRKVYLAPGYGIVGFVHKDRRYIRKY